MSVPKKRRTKGSVGRRRSHHGLGKATLTKCPECGKAVAPHIVCPNCGTYKGKKIVTIKEKKTKSGS